MNFKNIILNSIISSNFLSDRLRCKLYNLFGLHINTERIRAKCFMGGKDIYIGEDTFVNYNCYFNSVGSIHIGSKCDIGPEVMFCSSTHNISSTIRRAGSNIGKPIIIHDGCWIGARSLILPGVTIGQGSVIGAGSVVVKDCDRDSLYVGNPARKVREYKN